MTPRLRPFCAALLLALLSLAAPQGAAAQRGGAQTAPRDSAFAERMTPLMATDPQAAGEQAAIEIARLRRAARPSPSELASAYWIAAQAAVRTGDIATANQYLTQLGRMALPAGLRTRADGQIALLRGWMARTNGAFGEALLLYREAQTSFIRVRDTRGQAQALQALGTLYNDIGDGEAGARYLALAQDAYHGDDLFQLALYNNLGVAQQNQRNYAAALDSYTRANAIAERIDNAAYARHTRINMADAQLRLSQFEDARRTLARLGPPTALPDPAQRSNAQRLHALIALHDGRIENAQRLIVAALDGVDLADSGSGYRPTHYAAYEVFDAAGLAQAALVQLEAVRRIDTADAELNASNRAALLAAQFQFDAQEARIDRLKAEQLERDVINQRNLTYIVAASAVAVGLLLAGLLFLAVRSRARAQRDAAELSIVNRQLEGALAAKTEFLASTSHEIRTPLNGILGMTQIMLVDDTLSAPLRAQIELVHDAGTTMRALVDDILDVAKLEHGGFSIAPRPTDVSDLVRRVVRLYDAQAKDRGVDLVIETDDAIGWQDVDPDRMTQIIFNLVGNALKFTPRGSITVRLFVSEADGQRRLALDVADTGIGIAPEWHAAVFEMFRQVDNTRTRNYGGTGLGLAICRQLAQAMGGDISLDSAEGVGSTFHLTIPWAAVDAPQVHGRMSRHALTVEAVHGAKDNETSETQRRIAVVASDPMRAAMLLAMARQTDVVAVPAKSADDVNEMAGSGPVDWIVDQRVGDALAKWRDGAPPLAGRVMLVGADGDAVPEDIAQQFDELVTPVQFSRNRVAAILAQWGKCVTMSQPVTAATATSDRGHDDTTGDQVVLSRRAASGAR